MTLQTPDRRLCCSRTGLALDTMGHVILHCGSPPTSLFHERDLQGDIRSSKIMVSPADSNIIDAYPGEQSRKERHREDSYIED